MKKIIPIITALLLLFSCEKENNTCNCSNPLEDLPWLTNLKNSFTNCTCRITIFQANYNKETVFYSMMNDPLCNGYMQIALLNCDGDPVKTFEPPVGETFNKEVTDRKELYSCNTEK
ncbi:MAG TPA: hypothetical protein VK155_20365 [Bacteroidales bacterium]|nr:hypothetical protein [Bacteroidales bacterium]